MLSQKEKTLLEIEEEEELKSYHRLKLAYLESITIVHDMLEHLKVKEYRSSDMIADKYFLRNRREPIVYNQTLFEQILKSSLKQVFGFKKTINYVKDGNNGCLVYGWTLMHETLFDLKKQCFCIIMDPKTGHRIKKVQILNNIELWADNKERTQNGVDHNSLIYNTIKYWPAFNQY